MKRNDDSKREYDKDFPVEFCPVCGSDDTTCSGRDNPLLSNKHSWNTYCNNCERLFEIFILSKGEDKFRFRIDRKDCPTCKNEEKKWQTRIEKEK